jgi:hypothetical protein
MVMQSAEDRQGYNSSGRMDGSGDRSVLDKGQMRSSDVVVFRIRAEHMAQMSLPEDEDVIKALPADRADQPFGMAVLPRPSSGSRLGSRKKERKVCQHHDLPRLFPARIA